MFFLQKKYFHFQIKNKNLDILYIYNFSIITIIVYQETLENNNIIEKMNEKNVYIK